MHRVFNCGIGMVLVVSAADADRTVAHLNAAGETAWIVGDIRARNGDEAQTLLA
jgi:phosphoribosylformylglycinamidine cyclo-ligase